MLTSHLEPLVPLVDHNLVEPYPQVAKASFLSTNENDNLVYVNTDDLYKAFIKQLNESNMFIENDCQKFLNELMIFDKESINDLLISKYNKKDDSFYKKFINCYLNSGSGFDENVIPSMILAAFNSDDSILIDYGMTLYSIYKDHKILERFKGKKFNNPILQFKFNKIKGN